MNFEPGPILSDTCNVLGPSYTYPWGISFVDSSASWIWNLASAASYAPATTVEFVKTFFVPPNHPCMIGSAPMATLYMNIDNSGIAYVNGNQILETEDWSYTSTSTFTISTGSNILHIVATNAGAESNPAGLLVAVYCQNTLILHSDGSWCTGSSCVSDGNFSVQLHSNDHILSIWLEGFHSDNYIICDFRAWSLPAMCPQLGS